MRRLVICALLALTALAPAARAADGLPPIKHVWMFVLENKSLPQWYLPGLTTAPYLTQTLPGEGLFVPNFYGIGHSSLDNYVAMVSGQAPAPQTQDDCGDAEYHDMAPYSIRADGQVVDEQTSGDHGCIYPAAALTIGDQLEASGQTWKTYNEGIPAPCSTRNGGTDDPNYKRKHEPFLFFRSILDSPSCVRGVVGLDPLATDLQAIETTPNFSMIVPDQCNDGHDMCGDNTSLKAPDEFLRKWVTAIQASPAYKQDGMIIVTFDEGTDPLSCCNEQPGPNSDSPGGYGVWPNSGGGQSGQIMLSRYIKPGSITTKSYNHYSQLRSLEDLFGLGGHLGFAGQDGLKPFGSDVYNAYP